MTEDVIEIIGAYAYHNELYYNKILIILRYNTRISAFTCIKDYNNDWIIYTYHTVSNFVDSEIIQIAIANHIRNNKIEVVPESIHLELGVVGIIFKENTSLFSFICNSLYKKYKSLILTLFTRKHKEEVICDFPNELYISYMYIDVNDMHYIDIMISFDRDEAELNTTIAALHGLDFKSSIAYTGDEPIDSMNITSLFSY